MSTSVKNVIDEIGVAKYRNIVYFTTFLAYAMSHFSRKSYTNVKVQLKGEVGLDPILLSQMDTVFMFFYAIGSFFSGKLGDTYHAPTVIACGLFGSALCLFVLIIGIDNDIGHSTMVGLPRFFFLSIWLLHGLFQSTGGPVNTAIMGNWFGVKNRGYIFGTWTCHQYIGNIIAAVATNVILNTTYVTWHWALLLPAVCNGAWGLVCWVFLPEKPADVGLETEESIEKSQRAASAGIDPVGAFLAIAVLTCYRLPPCPPSPTAMH